MCKNIIVFLKSAVLGLALASSLPTLANTVEHRLIIPGMLENPIPSYPVVTLTASTDTININETVTINWTGTRFSNVTINGVVYQGNPGSATFSPKVDTRYEVTASNLSGQAVASVYVSVIAGEPTINAVLSPSTIFQNETPSTLNWTSTGADYVYITRIGQQTPNGEITLNPSRTKSYSVRAIRDDMITEQDVTLTILLRDNQSCYSLKQQDPNLKNGTYLLRTGSFYCDMSSGGWTLLFNQTYDDSEATGYFYSDNAAFYRSSEPSRTRNYSKLGNFEAFRRNGQFELKMLWPNGPSGVNHWIQTNSISTNRASSGYQPISIAYSGKNWQGLERNCTIGCAFSFADGSVDSGNWSFSVASYRSFNNGLNGPDGIAVPQVTLYVK